MNSEKNLEGHGEKKIETKLAIRKPNINLGNTYFCGA